MHPFYLTNAFTADPLGGNPAATVILEGADWPTDAWMQAVAAQFNLSETAFALPKTAGTWNLRWLTPRSEVDLCGHATLATAHALWLSGRAPAGNPIPFDTRSGRLVCEPRDQQRIAMDFPALPVKPIPSPPAALKALGLADAPAFEDGLALLLELENETAVREVTPDFNALGALKHWSISITARADSDGDFVSRFFAPQKGVPEDPVTGSAHCRLAPYWSAKLRKPKLSARQVSKRGGTLDLECHGDRVTLIGQAVCVGEGRLTL